MDFDSLPPGIFDERAPLFDPVWWTASAKMSQNQKTFYDHVEAEYGPDSGSDNSVWLDLWWALHDAKGGY